MREGPRPLRKPALAATALACAVAAGCGLGPGEETGEAKLTITRDFGSEQLVREEQSLRESDDVMSVLDRSADIETRYGGAFVDSIDGISGAGEDGRRTDWIFYVNGIESSLGAAEFEARDGDRIWWDYRDWTDVLRTPALVGSWPEPFVHGFNGERWETIVNCESVDQSPPPRACDEVSLAAEEAGIEVTQHVGPPGELPTMESGSALIEVGTWDVLSDGEVTGLLGATPARSGVFARFTGSGEETRLELLSPRAEVTRTLGPGAGLVAALRPGEGPPTWVVAGTDQEGVEAAAALLGEDSLRDRYAVATAGGEPIPVPVP